MKSRLDETYFIGGESYELNGERFTAYGCISFPLCLFVGAKHDPVAAIHFQHTLGSSAALVHIPALSPPATPSLPKAPLNDGKQPLLMTKVEGNDHPLAQISREEGRWQGIFGEDEKDVEVVLTNLCSTEWLLMEVVQDGLVTNKVNVIQPGQTMVVRGNQHTGHRAMRLQTIKDAATGAPLLTVEADLAAVASGEKLKEDGVQLKIRVAPSTTNPTLLADFKHPETQWRCVDRFVLRHSLPPVKKQLDDLIRDVHRLQAQVTDINVLLEKQERIESLNDLTCQDSQVYFKKSKTPSLTQRASNFFNSLLKRDEKSPPPPPPPPPPPTPPTPPKPPVPPPNPLSSADALNAALNSHASRLVVSDEVPEMAWQYVPDTYDRTCARTATVGLSVKTGIQWIKNNVLTKSALTELAQMAAKTREKTFVCENQNKHVPDECVVCLDAPPTILLFPCAHKCVCANPKCINFNVCPLCRHPVQAFLPIPTPTPIPPPPSAMTTVTAVSSMK